MSSMESKTIRHTKKQDIMVKNEQNPQTIEIVPRELQIQFMMAILQDITVKLEYFNNVRKVKLKGINISKMN